MPVPAASEPEPLLVPPPSDDVAEAEAQSEEATAELEPAASTAEPVAAPAPEPVSAVAAAEPSVPRMTAPRYFSFSRRSGRRRGGQRALTLD